MSKDKYLVEKISRLSRLKIDENEIEGFIKNFKDILNYIDLLNSLKIEDDTKDIEILNDYAVRDDSQVDKLSNEEVLLNASNKEGKFFAVKKVIEEDQN